MKVHVVIKDPQDLIELLDILNKLKKLRESIFANGSTEDFTVDIRTKIKA